MEAISDGTLHVSFLPPWMRRFGMMEAISDGTLHVSFLPPDLTSTCRSSFSPNNAEGSSLSLVPFIDSSRRATQPFTVGGKLVMGLLHRYTSRRFIKPPISSGSDVNLLLLKVRCSRSGKH